MKEIAITVGLCLLAIWAGKKWWARNLKRSVLSDARKQAEQGDTVAQTALGGIYWNGDGVAMNKTEAVKWYRKAAEQEYAKAQYALGLAYIIGNGVAEDKVEAVKWFRKAAEQGDAVAQSRRAGACVCANLFG